ncbi:hypothetical protein DSECCO2_564580 [anaerobic digester metagenome]
MPDESEFAVERKPVVPKKVAVPTALAPADPGCHDRGRKPAFGEAEDLLRRSKIDRPVVKEVKARVDEEAGGRGERRCRGIPRGIRRDALF